MSITVSIFKYYVYVSIMAHDPQVRNLSVLVWNLDVDMWEKCIFHAAWECVKKSNMPNNREDQLQNKLHDYGTLHTV
jgi:hypothetical protein